jgi:hypothetical protein
MKDWSPSAKFMKLRIQIIISATILTIFAFEIFVPGLLEALATLGRGVACVNVARTQGIKRAVILFLKEMW